MASAFLEVCNIYKSHEDENTLKGINLEVREGEIVCLLGPSGCGKTTLLRIIAGLEKAEQGKVLLKNKDISRIPPHKRNFSMMFQEFALFPHKDVFENVAFGLRMKKADPDVLTSRVKKIIDLVGLKGLEARDVNDLSGGERQRVALARSLAPEPQLLMLDEPMGSLDRALRERLTIDLRHILKKVISTAIFVTHDQNEAFILADRIAVINKGFIEQVGTPQELYRHPLNSFIAGFLGFQNLVPISGISNNHFKTCIGLIPVPEKIQLDSDFPVLLIRPEVAQILTDKAPSEPGLVLEGIIAEKRFQGAMFQLTVYTRAGSELVFHLFSDQAIPEAGSSIRLFIKSSALTVLKS
ncbi:ABC transporter ATP-binding protein [bacterium]|nr:ABC transporter ATP-binding protein [bacterium]